MEVTAETAEDGETQGHAWSLSQKSEMDEVPCRGASRSALISGGSRTAPTASAFSTPAPDPGSKSGAGFDSGINDYSLAA